MGIGGPATKKYALFPINSCKLIYPAKFKLPWGFTLIANSVSYLFPTIEGDILLEYDGESGKTHNSEGSYIGLVVGVDFENAKIQEYIREFNKDAKYRARAMEKRK